jgi:hypothetical protein
MDFNERRSTMTFLIGAEVLRRTESLLVTMIYEKLCMTSGTFIPPPATTSTQGETRQNARFLISVLSFLEGEKIITLCVSHFNF